jgi:hypothetical protein
MFEFRSFRWLLPFFILPPNVVGQEAEQLFPQQTSQRPVVHAERQAELSRTARWESFTARHGAWTVLWNEATKTPHRAFGPAIPLAS